VEPGDGAAGHPRADNIKICKAARLATALSLLEGGVK